MRKTIPFLMVLALVGCATFEATDPVLAKEPFQYTFDVPGLEKSPVFKKAQLWIAETYNSAESVITFRDEGTGMIKGTAIGSARVPGDLLSRDFRYALSISCRDKRTRIEFSNVRPSDRFSGTQRVAGVDIAWKVNYEAVKRYFDGLSNNFRAFMLSDQKEDW
jgi:hypothetical protein